LVSWYLKSFNQKMVLFLFHMTGTWTLGCSGLGDGLGFSPSGLMLRLPFSHDKGSKTPKLKLSLMAGQPSSFSVIGV